MPCLGCQHTSALLISRKCAPPATAEWAVQLLLLPVEALELLHSFVCLQVGAAFSEPWAINNTVQVGEWAAGWAGRCAARRAGRWVGA